MSAASVHPRLARALTSFAAAASLAVAIVPPATYFWTAWIRETAVAQAEAERNAHDIAEMVARNPTHWQFEAVRIAALLVEHPEGRPAETRRVLDQRGRVIVTLFDEVQAPSLTIRAPVIDAGRVVGQVEIVHSLRGSVVATAWIAAATLALALAAFTALQVLPLRMLRRALARAAHFAVHDVLTGLPNRARMHERVELALALARRDGGHAAVLLLDLDRFKSVNDVHGHAAGDRLLQQVAERLRAAVREVDAVARLGGDEFAVAVHVDTAKGAERLARRIVAALEVPFEISGATVRIGCSVGVALGPADGDGAELLASHADAALYRAKADGRSCFHFFETGMDLRIRERVALEADLRSAIARNELVPHYQPLVELSSSRLVGFEMLARWPHPTRGMVSPEQFVPIAEEAGLIGPMTERLMRRACCEAAAWPGYLTLAVNVSPVQLRDRGLPGLVRAMLAESGLPAARLEIELTESALVSDFALAQLILGELKAIGVRLALDDFGTGYSSLKHLQELPIDKLKIDAGFVRSMVGNVASRKIVAAVIGLGHSLGLPTVGEGIEDDATAATLSALGCDLGQGWLYGRAVTAEAVQAMLLSEEWTGEHARTPTPPLPIGPDGEAWYASAAGR